MECTAASEQLHVRAPVMYHVLFFLLLLKTRVSPLPYLSHLLFVSALFRCWCLKIEREIHWFSWCLQTCIITTTIVISYILSAHQTKLSAILLQTTCTLLTVQSYITFMCFLLKVNQINVMPIIAKKKLPGDESHGVSCFLPVPSPPPLVSRGWWLSPIMQSNGRIRLCVKTAHCSLSCYLSLK